MTFSPITSWQIEAGKVETVMDFVFLGSKIIVDCDYRHEIKRHLLLGRKAVTNLDSVLKSRDVTLLTKVYRFKNEEKKVKVARLCPTLCDPMDYTSNGILQIRVRG